MTKRCAVYTRKSSDEGLDQAFNSLDAQREACEAYIASQRHEGWKLCPWRYDDGGYSGGTMERPGLRALLADVDAGLVDVIVVYKVDRLTRALSDFARIIERLDAREASFVSVTQAFNTTSSMGRLTLNVLLSFAQFEREVTGERIRDKIAASKKKGMWMGGTLPLGYDRPLPGTHVLRVNEDEAETVRAIFARYLALGSVHALAQELEAQGVVSKRRITEKGKVLGGIPFSRGALFHLLRNPVYLGKITHKGTVHEGSHAGLVDEDLFDAVQRRLDHQRRRHKASTQARGDRAPLTGRLFDAAGHPMSPTSSRGQAGRTYRYYVAAPLQQGKRSALASAPGRIPAPAIEGAIAMALGRILPSACDPLALPQRITVHAREVELLLPAKSLREARGHLGAEERIEPVDRDHCLLTLPPALGQRGARKVIATSAAPDVEPDPVLIAALRKAHRLLGKDGTILSAPRSPYERRLLRLAFLAPAIQRDILAGRQPRHANLDFLLKAEIPLSWAGQHRHLRWPA
jgi:site-specific DNA recombinase